MSSRHTATASCVFHLLAPGEDRRSRATSVPVQLSFDAADPFAVHLRFATGPGRDVRWVFARTLLADGLLGRVGEGDVRVWPAGIDEDVLLVELDSPSGHARFEVSATAVADFLDQTYQVVLPGRESDRVDVDSALAALLTTGGR